MTRPRNQARVFLLPRKKEPRSKKAITSQAVEKQVRWGRKGRENKGARGAVDMSFLAWAAGFK